MKEIILTSRQLMSSPDIQAYELGQIPTPQEMENNKKINYILIGVLTAITIGLFSYYFYQVYQENKSKNLN
jgi:uncharacterized membrane protein